MDKLSESYTQIADSITKLSATLLVLPMVFLGFVSEIGNKANPEALQGVYIIGNTHKSLIFISFSISIVLGFVGRLLIAHDKHKSGISVVYGSILFFIVGLIALLWLFFLFPIEILEPLKLGRTRLH